MKGRYVAVVMIALALAVGGSVAVLHRATASAVVHGGPPNAGPTAHQSRVVIEVFDAGFDVILQGEHADHLERRLAAARLLSPWRFSCTLVDMSLASGEKTARYLHSTGVVEEIDAHQDGPDLAVSVSFRGPVRQFEAGPSGGFIISVGFS